MEWQRAREQRRAFEEFVAAATPGLRRTAYLLSWDPQEADDLLQLMWTSIARHWPRVGRMASPLAYARRVLTNAAIDGQALRTRRRQELAGAEQDARDVPDHEATRDLHAVDDRAELRGALGQLTPRQRAVLVLRYWDDLPEQEVAELLGCSVGTVKSTASRALAQLRATLTRTT